jgi:TIGR03009 family protein
MWTLLFGCSGAALAQTTPATRQPARTAARGDTRSEGSGRAAASSTRLPDARGGSEQNASPNAKAPADQRQPAGPIVKQIAPQAPFVLTESQQKLLDQILAKWEKQSDKVNTFRCSFTRWEYDKAFGNPSDNFKKSQGQGEIRYKSPDCGEYRISSLSEFDPIKKVESPKSEGLDHWLCDGEAIFEFNSAKKQLIERRLAPELKGKAIADGPLPFVFGAKADQLKRRYWLRDVTPKEEIGKKIWLEAFPKFQQDAANFQSATIILNDSDCMPFALRLVMPGGASNSDYHFASGKLNDPFAVVEYLMPKISPLMAARGWRHVVEDDGTESAKKSAPGAGEAPQAKRAPAGQQRK